MGSKKLLSYAISIVIAIGAIYLLQPLINSAKAESKYDFTVTTVDGDISKKDFNGKVLAIYFGYMYCPDVCPTSLSALASALKSFPQEKVDNNFKGLFISVDKERDKLKALKEYAQYFHPTYIGATSNKENIDDITNRYESYYKKVFLKDSAMDYSVSHTSYIYIFDKEGKLAAKVDHFAHPDQIKEVLKGVL